MEEIREGLLLQHKILQFLGLLGTIMAFILAMQASKFVQNWLRNCSSENILWDFGFPILSSALMATTIWCRILGPAIAPPHLETCTLPSLSRASSLPISHATASFHPESLIVFLQTNYYDNTSNISQQVHGRAALNSKTRLKKDMNFLTINTKIMKHCGLTLLLIRNKSGPVAPYSYEL